MKFNKIILHILFVIISIGLNATTVSPYINLGDLGKASDMVVLAKVTKNYQAEINGLNRYLTQISLTQIIKGNKNLLNQEIDMMSFKYDTKELSFRVAGDISLDENKTYLLFLSKKDNYWTTKVMAYYVFEEIIQDNITYLHPIKETAQIEVVERPDGQLADPICTYFEDKLVRHLDNVINGNGKWDLSSVIAKGFLLNNPQDRALPTGCVWFMSGSNNARWPNSPSVKVYSEDDGDAAYGSSNSATYVNNARIAMNAQYTGLALQSGGTTNYTPNCVGGSAKSSSSNFFSSCPNGANTILIIYNDPCSEIADLSGCSGTLAMGGFYMSSSTHTWKSETWSNGLYGFVIVNNGTGACMTPGNFTIMLTHEMTHACGMDHLDDSLYPSQNMNPFCCNAINTKDKECMNYVYTLSLPVDNIDLKGVSKNGSTYLSWATNFEKNNMGFEIERSEDGAKFQKVGFTKGFGNSNKPLFYEFEDKFEVLNIQKAYYRLKQIDFDGASKYSDIISIDINNLQDGTLFKFSPNPTQNVITINFVEKITSNHYLSIYDINGKRLKMIDIESESGSQVIDLNSYPKGVYNITLETNNGKVLQSNRVIKQ